MGELDSRIKIRAPLRCDGIGRLDCAEDTESGRRMAVRWLPLEANGDAAVKACEKLPAHPTLPTIRQTGQVGASAFVAMDFPEGQMLAALLGEPLDIDIVMRVGAQLADVLAVVHSQGVVHGELGAESVLLVPPDRAYLWDMPLVIANRLTDRRGEARLMHNLVRMAPFLAPERARGEGSSQAGDVYSLGAVLCVAAGAPLPSATTTLGAVHLLATGAWAPRVPPSMPRAARAMVERMIAPDPASRPTAREVADAFGQQLVPAMPTVPEMPAVRLTPEQLVAAGLAPAPADAARAATVEIPRLELAAKQAESAAVTPPAAVAAVKPEQGASASTLAPVKAPVAAGATGAAPATAASASSLKTAPATAASASALSPVKSGPAADLASAKPAAPATSASAAGLSPVKSGPVAAADLASAKPAAVATSSSGLSPVKPGPAADLASAKPAAATSASASGLSPVKGGPVTATSASSSSLAPVAAAAPPKKASGPVLASAVAEAAGLADTLPPHAAPANEAAVDTRHLPTLEIPRIKKPAVQLTDTITVAHDLAAAGAQAVAPEDPSARATRRLMVVGAVLLAAVLVMAVVAVRLASRPPTAVAPPAAAQTRQPASSAAAVPVQDDLAPLPTLERPAKGPVASSAAARLRSTFRVAHAAQQKPAAGEPEAAPAPSNDFDFLDGAPAPTSELKRPDL